MGEKSSQIASDIEHIRAELGSDLQELEGKVKGAADWRRQVRNHPWTLLGVAFAVGVFLAAVLGPRRPSR